MRPPRRVIIAALACFLCLASSLSARAQRPRVAVIAVGDSPGAVGNVQMSVEELLVEKDNIELVPSKVFAHHIARRIHRPDPAKWKPSADADRTFREAKNFYFEDQLTQAIRTLETVEAMYDDARAPTPVRAKTELLLWKTAIHLALEENDAALVQARTALTLDPELQVDRTVFPPSVFTLIRDTREALVSAVVQIETNPAGAGIEIDERLVDIEFRVPSGAHTIVVHADYFEPVEREFSLQRFIGLKIGLPIAVDPLIKKWLINTVEQTTRPSGYQKLQLSRLRQILGVDVLVVVSSQGTRGQRRALVFWEGGETRLSPVIEEARAQGVLFNWMTTVLDELARPDQTPTPSPWVGWRFNATGGPAYGSRFRRLRNAEETAGFKAGFNGTGLALHLDADRAGILAELDVDYLAYPGPTATVTAGSNSVEVKGGKTLGSRIAFGYRYRLGNNGEVSRSWVDATIGGRLWTHTAEDVGDSTTGPWGVFSSYRWLAIDIRVRGAYLLELDLFGDPMVHAGFTVSPFSGFKERVPLNGTEPSPMVAYGWELGASLLVTKRLRVRLDYHGERLDVRFKGQAAVPTTPPILDARWAETRHTWLIQAHREF